MLVAVICDDKLNFKKKNNPVYLTFFPFLSFEGNGDHGNINVVFLNYVDPLTVRDLLLFVTLVC